MTILLVDHHDSFTFNIWQVVAATGTRCEVVLVDAVDLASIRRRQPSGIILSPGPCSPREAGASTSIVVAVASGDLAVPLLGVCLGHQVIGAALGATVRRSHRPVHGRATAIRHDGKGIFEGLPSPLVQARYNSLVLAPETLPADLEPCAWSDDGDLMALRHRRAPIDGVQFHPESFLSELGGELFANWLSRIVAASPAPTAS